MSDAPVPTVVGDRLYSISLRPQELALYGEHVNLNLRYSPIFDDADEAATRHFKLLVLEMEAEVPAEATGSTPRRLQLLKCGWEIELATTVPATVGSLGELRAEVPLLLGRIADTVNELARRARLEAPLTTTVIDDLVAEYRQAGAARG